MPIIKSLTCFAVSGLASTSYPNSFGTPVLPCIGPIHFTYLTTDNSLPATGNWLLTTVSQPLSGDVMNQVADSAGVAPLIVIPRDNLHAVTGHHAGHGRINDRRARISPVIDGDQFSGLVSQVALQRARFGRGFQCVVHLF